MSFVEKLEKHVVDDKGVVLRFSTREEIEFDAQFCPGNEELSVVTLGYLCGGRAFLVGLYGYRGAMLIATRDHEHLITLGAMVPGKNVGGQICTGDMTQVQGTISIRPGNAYEDSLRQLLTSMRFYHNYEAE